MGSKGSCCLYIYNVDDAYVCKLYPYRKDAATYGTYSLQRWKYMADSVSLSPSGLYNNTDCHTVPAIARIIPQG
ncbi:MAG: hypothetical protein BWY95_02527 [Bacteroidetes bacterium ADurb.BinA104]|nr:MAG: hypothetical protein BWY95_02527 [Bacteroidetes bacterium ADurb.BinA104]